MTSRFSPQVAEDVPEETGSRPDGGALADRVTALLAAGVTPEDLARTRARVGVTAPPDRVVADLEAGAGSRLPLDGHPPPPSGRLLVHGHTFPAALDQTWDAGGPLWLHHHGAPLPTGPCVAVVGTRSPTADGLHLAADIAADLAAAGVAVVSGMARGIDQAAHRGALRSGGPTTAVLGTGLAVDYPARSGPLRAAVAASGGVVTEYSPHRGVRHRCQFTDRNRILVGLCEAVVVVEAGARSGALNSAGWAADMGRDVLVVPSSPSNPAAAGSLALLRDGAQPVRDARDVLAALGLGEDRPSAPARQGRPGPSLSAGATTLLPLLGPVPASPSALATAAGLSARQVLIALSELEEVGLAARDGTGVTRRRGR